jgi:predicted component of type VI protein secretion system
VVPSNLFLRVVSDLGTRNIQGWTRSSLKVSSTLRKKTANIDHTRSTLAVDNDTDTSVSRNHCEIYTVVYEPTVNHIYVRDRKSSNGTFVNGQLIGSGPEISPGYLLQDGDVIEIRPY